MHMAMVDAGAVATLLFADAVGPTWSGAPNAAAVFGTAVGTVGLSRIMSRRGRRAGLLFGYAMAGAGAVLATMGAAAEAIPVVVVALAMVGLGNGGAQLSRYAAAELYPPARRGFGLGAVVWAGTLGAVLGPALIAPASGEAGGTASYGGVFRVVAIIVLGAALAAWTLPRRRATPLSPPPRDAGTTDVAPGEGTIRLAAAAMVTGQVVMAAVMTMTPLHMHHHGHGLAAVASVISAHTFGMFALSPLSGRLTDRFGAPAAIGTGLALMAVAAVIAVTATPEGGVILGLGLGLLGLGWNLGHVGGSALLSHGSDLIDTTRRQGTVDGIVWGSSAVATLASGVIFDFGGYTMLGLVATTLIVYPASLLVKLRRANAQRQLVGAGM
jgi:MFS family permease